MMQHSNTRRTEPSSATASTNRAGPLVERQPRMPSERARLQWPVLRQATGADRLGRGAAVQSPRQDRWVARTETADKVVASVCPYCAVGCGQRIYVKNGQVVQIAGDPDSPVSRGRLCPKGSASKQLV